MGLATSRRLAAAGRKVVGLDLDEEGLARVQDELGDAFRGIAGDVGEPRAHGRAADAAEEHGDLTGWVNAAGIWISTWAHDFVLDDWDRTLRVNLLGVALGCSLACQRFLAAAAGGSIVNISSMDSIAAFPDGFAYDAAKGGVDALTRQVAVDYGPAGIRCNAVRPGTILTPLTEAFLAEAPDREAELESWRTIHPIGRIGAPDDVAAVIAFLLSDDASFVTGACIPVDGGATAKCVSHGENPRVMAHARQG
jgi:NAD(P)-dependent dehydrogenase (short-subunit alcohol dehydrogenase family)